MAKFVPLIGVVAILFALSAVPRVGMTQPAATATSLDVRDVWADIAGELRGEVPARLLLGGEGESSRLDAALRRHGMTREAFARVASDVLTEYARHQANSEVATLEAVTGEIGAIDLPDFVTMPHHRPRAPRPPISTTRNDLVADLMRRLPAGG